MLQVLTKSIVRLKYKFRKKFIVRGELNYRILQKINYKNLSEDVQHEIGDWYYVTKELYLCKLETDELFFYHIFVYKMKDWSMMKKIHVIKDPKPFYENNFKQDSIEAVLGRKMTTEEKKAASYYG